MAKDSDRAGNQALDVVRQRAARRRESSQQRIERAGLDRAWTDLATARLAESARLTLNFHPDRKDRLGRTVAKGLLVDGIYRSQSETGLSNGQRFAGGARNLWETELFDDAYGDSLAGRPIYGAFDLTHDLHGGSPRFGSSFLVMRSHCLERATLCIGDSHLGPTDVGTAQQLVCVLAGLIEQCQSGTGFGQRLSFDALTEAIDSRHFEATTSRDLDHYIEAQIHGGVSLATDVDRVVVDPSFAGTAIEADLRQASAQFAFGFEWHPGSQVEAQAIPDDFRGPGIAQLAREAVDDRGLIDAAVIGRALEPFAYVAPGPDGDAEDSHLQRYKKLWHCCLALGDNATERQPGEAVKRGGARGGTK